MTTSEREAAWARYAQSLGRLSVKGESLEIAEIDFKAGYDAGSAARGTSASPLAVDRGW